MRAFLLNFAAATLSMVAAMDGRVLRRDDLAAADLGRPAGYNNLVILLQPLDADRLPDVASTLDDFFALSGGEHTGEVGLFSAWPTPDLRPYGWQLGGHPPLHVLPPGRELPSPPPGLTIAPVHDEAALAEWERTTIRGFPMPGLEDAPPGAICTGRALADPHLRLWLGRADGQAVAASAAYVAYGVNHVTLVATVPEARRRGYGEELTWRAALAEPGLPAVLISSDDGRPVYDRMGFIPLFRFTFWDRHR